ncbi:MAG: hypothetical protein P4L73_12730 [Caulobacteraceae bacterium]|nr:hypothetical protein [Caulobacteraceae bacterium]
MLTRQIDAALDALEACRTRAPHLRDCYRPGTPERAALDELVAALERTDAALRPQTGRRAADGPRTR